jgi:hypothetical protein
MVLILAVRGARSQQGGSTPPIHVRPHSAGLGYLLPVALRRTDSFSDSSNARAEHLPERQQLLDDPREVIVEFLLGV